VQFLFDDYRLDTDRRELWHGREPVPMEPQVFDVLVYLVQNRDRVVSKDDLIATVWNGRIVSDAALTSRINAARTAIGDNGKEQRLIRTVVRKGVRFVAEVKELDSVSDAPARVTIHPSASPAAQRQQIQFCTAPDSVRIAYAEVGAGPPLVKAANWLNHLEYDWESPVWKPLLHALAGDYRLVRYDERGTGLSDANPNEISVDSFVRDLEGVVDSIGLDRFPLLGMCQGGATAITYAARHPDRVSRLVIVGGYARGTLKRAPIDAEQFEAIMTLARHGWGQDNPAFRQIFTYQFIPQGTHEQVCWFNDLMKETASPQNAERIMRAMANFDVEDLLPQIRVPTLVLHCRNDARVPWEEGRRIATGIPGARFVTLEGHNHIVLESEPAWTGLLNEIKNFLRD
jgi:pimeloyl-ACP methyl ester carboxylesterase/DNA-binding winged helix-turn-helix (wHTH) protein